MTMTLAEVIDGVIKVEGGYSDNPDDSGGETMYGITEAEARANAYTGPMALMPRDLAVKIYWDRYITEPNFDAVYTLSASVGYELIDSGINCGTGTASKWLQRWLNVFNARGKRWPDMKIDGQIGPATLSALRTFLQWRGTTGEQVMVRALNCSQGAHYLWLAEQREKDEDFIYGWMLNRIVML